MWAEYNYLKQIDLLKSESLLKEKSKVCKYAKWLSKWSTNESLVSDLFK